MSEIEKLIAVADRNADVCRDLIETVKMLLDRIQALETEVEMLRRSSCVSP